MITNKSRGHVVSFLLGSLMGVVLLVAGGTGKAPEPATDPAHQIATFADLKIESLDLGYLQRPEARRALSISKNGATIVYLFENTSGQVDNLVIQSDQHDMAVVQWKDHQVAQLGVLGNPVAGKSEGQVVLVCKGSEQTGLWDMLTYTGRTSTTQGDSQPPLKTSEMYQDLDVDGQFDTKHLLNDKVENISVSIRLDGRWKEIRRVDEDGRLVKKGSYQSEQRTASCTEGEVTTDYRFHCGFGWKLEQTAGPQIQ